MLIEYEDEEEFHREQLQKNRQALVFVFLLMVGIVFLGDQEDQPPARHRGRRSHPGSMGGLGPVIVPQLYETSVPFDPDAFGKQNEIYGFRVVSPPSLWGIVDNQFGDYRIIAHNEFDRPMAMVPSLHDLYRCHWHDNDKTCEFVSGINWDDYIFSPVPDGDKNDYRLRKAVNSCETPCDKGMTCVELSETSHKQNNETPIGVPTCVPDPLGLKTGVTLDDDSLFYYSVTPEEEYMKALQNKSECIKKKSEALEKMEAMEGGAKREVFDRRTPLGFDETDGLFTHRSSSSNGDFYPICATRIDLQATREMGKEIQFHLACRGYTGYREITNPIMIIPLKEHLAVIGFNALGNFTVVSYPTIVVKDDFDGAFSGKNDTKLQIGGKDPVCEPPLGTGPRQAYSSSFNGLRTGWFFPPKHEDKSEADAQLILVGDGGQWYSSRITLDLERGYYNEDSIYKGFRRF